MSLLGRARVVLIRPAQPDAPTREDLWAGATEVTSFLQQPPAAGREWVPGDPPELWQPGDPIYTRAGHAHSQYFANIRVDSDSEDCTCADAADWPQQARRALPPGDELGALIAEHQAARKEQQS